MWTTRVAGRGLTRRDGGTAEGTGHDLQSVAAAIRGQRQCQRSELQPLYQRRAAQRAFIGDSVDHQLAIVQDVHHLEIDLADSGLRYQPGDALGMWYENDPAQIVELPALLWLKVNEPVEAAGQKLSLSEALQKHYELTQNTQAIVESYAALVRDKALLA